MASENQDIGTPPGPPPQAIGFLLREARQSLGHDLGAVAVALCIRQPYLEAIESGRYHELPGSAYAVGFVRGYADYLGLDSAEVVRRFKQETGSDYAGRHELVFPSTTSEGSFPTGSTLFLALLAAAVAYGAWYWYSKDASVAESVPALPDRLAALIHNPVIGGPEAVPVTPPVAPVETVHPGEASIAAAPPPAAAPQPAAAVSQPREDVVPPNEADGSAAAEKISPPSPVAAAPAASPLPETMQPALSLSTETPPPPDPKAVAKAAREAKRAEAKAAREAAKAAAAEAAQAALAAGVPLAAGGPAVDPSAEASGGSSSMATQPVTMPAHSATARVTLKASEDCWITIRDASGAVVHSHLLHKGESYTVQRRPGQTLTAGNAGALTLVVDGKASPPLGSAGMVRHGVPLDPERIETTDPVAPPPAPVAVPEPVPPPQ